MSEIPPELSSNLEVIAKREKIAEALLKGKSLSETKALARNPEIGIKIKNIADILKKDEITVSKENQLIMENIQHQLVEKFPNIEGLSIILFGSSVHGGGMVRKELGTQAEQDLDIAFIIDDKINGRFHQINVRNYIDEILQKNYKKELHPTNIYTESLTSINDATKKLIATTTIEPERKEYAKEEILIYLFPSFPSEVNEKNRALLLEALNKIYKDNPSQWSKIKNEVLEIWERYHKLEPKHLIGKNTKLFYKSQNQKEGQRGKILRENTSQISQFDMSVPMDKLIRGTKNPK